MGRSSTKTLHLASHVIKCHKRNIQELEVPVSLKFDDPQLRTWLLLHQVYNLITKAEDAVYAKIGLTTQHYAVLLAMKFIKSPITPSVIAQWLDRNTNTITTLVDRMEKVNLVKRVRNLRDRRSVRLVMTKSGKEVLDRAMILNSQLVQDLLQGLSEEEMRSLSELLEKVRGGTFEYLHPGKVSRKQR